jgi:hypothetical protein
MTATWGQNSRSKGAPRQANPKVGDLGAKASDETILGGQRSRFETVAACTPAIILGGCVMWTVEHDNTGSQSWDPALWSIGTVIGIAILYVACLT